MNAAAIIATLRARRAHIEVLLGDRIAVSPSAVLDDDLRKAIRREKPALVALLNNERPMPPDPTAAPTPCACCHGTVFWRKGGTTELICCTCQPNPDLRGSAWYFACSGDPLDVLLNPEVRAALDWLVSVDTAAADAIVLLIFAVERGNSRALSKLLDAVDVAVDRYDRRATRGR